jgi:hypothetical protein
MLLCRPWAGEIASPYRRSKNTAVVLGGVPPIGTYLNIGHLSATRWYRIISKRCLHSPLCPLADAAVWATDRRVRDGEQGSVGCRTERSLRMAL